MLLTRQELEEREQKQLAPYAVRSGGSAGREFTEEEDPYRTCFQRDRDRIIHSKSFRRLAGKTQVFIATFGDHFRDRLSHSLEVAQIARDIARTFGCNEDLAEAIALAHDLGHTPFGHAGQDALNEVMARFGLHFEHNEQSRRIVEQLEKRSPQYDGLNLTLEVRQGLSKHQTYYDQKGKQISGKTLEAQIVDFADEIAYHSHDIDDGLRSKLFSLDDLKRLRVWKRAGSARGIITVLIADLCEETERRLRKARIKTVEDVFSFDDRLAGFSEALTPLIHELRRFLWENMYERAEVTRPAQNGQRIIKSLFEHYHRSPDSLPAKLRERAAREPLEVVVKDYIAGMTDEFASERYQMFFERVK